jgi:hypothetical protein
MPHYRIYVTTTDGHVTAPATVIECDDDQEAIAKAERYINGRAVELWEGARFIVRFSSWEGLAPVTPLDQLRLQLPDHDFDRLIQAAKPIAPPERDAFLKLAFGGDRLALLELSVEDSAYGQSYAQCASRTA